MARTITVSPVIPSDGGSYELLARSIQAGQEAKRRREQATRDAIIEQQKANQLIFGNTNEELRKFYTNAASVPTEIRDNIIAAGINKLKQSVGSPNFYSDAQNIMNTAFTSFNKYDTYFKGVKDAVTDLEAQGYDPKSLAAFANQNVFDEQKDQQGNVISRNLRDISEITDPKTFILQEATTNPELYINRAKLNASAFKEMDEIMKNDALVANKLTYDPTGKKVSSLGYEYKLSPFEREEDKTDTTTGLKYKVPVLDIKSTSITIPGSKETYTEIDPVRYDNMQNILGPAAKQKVYIGAIDNIKEHNARILKEAGHPNPVEASLAISEKNIGSFMEKAPGLVNPYEQSSVDTFSRIYMPEFLKSVKQYGDTGESKAFKLDAGVKVDTPKAPTVIKVGSEEKIAGLTWMQNMEKAMKVGDVDSINNYLGALYGGGGKKLVGEPKVVGNIVTVNYEGEPDKRQMIQVNGKWQVNPNEGKSTTQTITFDITSPRAVQQAAGLYQKIMGADKNVEGYAVKKSGAKSLN
jgi:microcystin-dependent protein